MKKLTIFTCIMLLLVFSLPAYAGQQQYWVIAEDTNSGNAYGIAGTNYVMSNPTIGADDPYGHVSSFYIRDEWTNSMSEVGWHAYTVGTTRYVKFFGAWSINGIYNDAEFGNAPLNSNHNYQLEAPVGTDTWYFYIDGVNKKTQVVTGMKYGVALASSERNSLTATNYSHFWNLKEKNNLGSFYNWLTLDFYRNPTDPEYTLNIISNTACEMYKP